MGVWLAGPALSAVETEDLYRFDAWKTQHGLPQNAVKAILQTQDGYLWLTTRFGVVRFDGKNFQVFDRANTPDLPSDAFGAIAEDRQDHSLWLAHRLGIIHFKNQTIESFSICSETSGDHIRTMCPSREGGVWIVTVSGLQRFERGHLRQVLTYEGLPGNQIHTVLEDEVGVLWMGMRKGVQRRELATGKITEVWKPEKGLEAAISCLYKDREGGLWIATANAGLKRYHDGVLTSYDAPDSLPSNNITFITQDTQGNLWIVLGDGKLLRFRDGRFSTYGKKEGLSDDVATCVHEDREGNLWVGTEFGGLNRLQRRRLRAYSARDGLGHNNTWSICEGKKGRMWIATAGGLTCFRDGTFVNYLLGEGSEDNQVKTVLEDSSGNVWAGTQTAGLRVIRDGIVTCVSATGRKDHDQVNALYEDRSGTVWVGTFMGLDRLQNGILSRRYTTEDGLANNDVRAVHEDRDGNLWIATYGGGLSRMRDGYFTTFTTRNGLSDNIAWIIHEDDEGVLWVGTEQGLTRIKDGKFTSFTKREGLFDNVINDVLEDGQGHLWIGCNRGIYCVEKRQLTDVAEGRAIAVSCVSYGVSDGMLSSETNGENQPAACKARDGRLWFPTTEGVVVIDPTKTVKNDLPPPVVLEEVRIDRQIFDPSGPARLPPGRGTVVEFHYTANSLTAPEKILFRYRLDGCDPEWTKAGTRREAYYTNLRPGQYQFQVVACNNHGVWNNDGASFAFYLAPHFYQTYPFYACTGLFVGLLGYGSHRLRVNVVKKIERLERQHALEKERTRIANEMHDDLGSSLTQIALTSELAGREFSDNAKAGEHLQNITDTTREVFRAMDEIVWAVNPKHDTLDSLVAYVCKYAQRFLRPAGVRCRLDLPDQLPPHGLTAEERHNLFLALKEGLNNIVKHASASEVWIRVKLHGSDCIIRIEDNGRGFDVEPAKPDGNGLSSMRARLNAIGGSFEIRSHPDKGTQLQMFVHLKESRLEPSQH